METNEWKFSTALGIACLIIGVLEGSPFAGFIGLCGWLALALDESKNQVKVQSEP